MIKPDPAKIMRSHLYAPSIRLQTQCNNQSNDLIDVTATIAKRRKRGRALPIFFQYFFFFTHFLSRIIYDNCLLGRDVSIYSYPHRSSPARKFLTQ